MSNGNNDIKAVKITDLHKLLGTEDTIGMYQIFQSVNDEKIEQSMVLDRTLLEELGRQIQEVLNKE